MNQEQRRAAGAPTEEQKRIMISIKGGVAVLRMVGVKSLVTSKCELSPALCLRLGWALIKCWWKTR